MIKCYHCPKEAVVLIRYGKTIKPFCDSCAEKIRKKRIKSKLGYSQRPLWK